MNSIVKNNNNYLNSASLSQHAINNISLNTTNRKRTLLIDALNPDLLKVALIGHNQLLDFEYHSKLEEGKGSIHLGTITRVLPGLQAVFVKYKNSGRDGFLPFSEIDPIYLKKNLDIDISAANKFSIDHKNDHNVKNDSLRYAQILNEDGLDSIIEEQQSNEILSTILSFDEDNFANNFQQGDAIYLENFDAGINNEEGAMVYDENQEPLGYICKNQVIMVQVAKEERDNKGATLSSFINIAGRYCIFMPNKKNKNAISKNINNTIDRKRLALILNNLHIKEGSILILNSAVRSNAKEIKHDYEFLSKLWEEIKIKASKINNVPSLVHHEDNLIKNILYNLNILNVKNIIIEGENTYNHAIDFCRSNLPSYINMIKLHHLSLPIFMHYGVDFAINKLFSNIIDLKSGGYIVLNKTEALMSIDVNSGKSKDEFCIEETALKTNLEAIQEIMIQLKLRKIAGLIVVDLIGMRDPYNTKSIESTAKRLAQYDKSKIQIYLIEEFSLLVISRQRIGQSLLEIHAKKCPTCNGFGYSFSDKLIVSRLFDEIKINLIQNGSANFEINLNQNFLNILINEYRNQIYNFEKQFNCQLRLIVDFNLPINNPFKIHRIELDSDIGILKEYQSQIDEDFFKDNLPILSDISEIDRNNFILEEDIKDQIIEDKLNINKKPLNDQVNISNFNIAQTDNVIIEEISEQSIQLSNKENKKDFSVKAKDFNGKQNFNTKKQEKPIEHDLKNCKKDETVLYKVWNEWLNQL